MGQQPKIEVYGTQHCGYCTAARLLLKKKGLHFEDILVSTNADARAEMQERSGGTTVPQVFINGQVIGGFDELYELEQSGDLDKLLGTHVVVTDDQ
jgi:glutaredoxin 3